MRIGGVLERTYWMTNKEWYRMNLEKDCFELTDKAPEEAIKSFKLWNTPIPKRYDKKGNKYYD